MDNGEENGNYYLGPRDNYQYYGSIFLIYLWSITFDVSVSFSVLCFTIQFFYCCILTQVPCNMCIYTGRRRGIVMENNKCDGHGNKNPKP